MSDEDCRNKYLRWKDCLDRDEYNLNHHISEIIAELNRFEENVMSLEEKHMFINVFLPQYLKILLEKRFFCSPRADYCFILDFFYSLLPLLLKNLAKPTEGCAECVFYLLDYEKSLYSRNICIISPLTERDLVSASEKQSKSQDVFFDAPSKGLNSLFKHLLNYFIHIQGFSSLAEYSSRCQNIDHLTHMLKLITSLDDVMMTISWRKSTKPVYFNCVSAVVQFNEESIKSIQKSEVRALFNAMAKYISQYKDKPKYSHVLESCELETFYKLLIFGNLEKKIFGISELVNKINQAKNLDEDNEKRAKGLPVFSSEYREVAKWLTTDKYLAWLDSKDFCSFLFSSIAHPEILKRSSDILKFLYSNSRISQDQITELWETTFKKHEAEREALTGLIQDLTTVMDCDDLKFLYGKIEAVPLGLVDFQVLQVVKSYAKLGNCFWPSSKKRPREDETDEPKDDPWGPFLENVESGQAIPLPAPENLIPLAYPDAETQVQSEIRTFDTTLVLELLWKMWLEPEELSCDLSRQAGSILKDSLLYNYRDQRIKFIVKCLENIKTNSYVLKSCELIKSLVESFPGGSQPAGSNSKTSVIATLNNDHQFLKELLKNLILFKKKALEFARLEVGNSELNGNLEPLFSIIKVDKDLVYLEELRTRLDFLNYVFGISQDLITQNSLMLLYETFVLNSVSERESEQFFSWLSLFITSWTFMNSLAKEIKIFIFKDLLVKIEAETFTSSAFDCFEKFFIGLNKDFSLIKTFYYEENFEVFDIKLIGIENLWEIMLASKSDLVFSSASRLMKKVYKGFRTCEKSVQEEFIHSCMSSISSCYHVTGLSQEEVTKVVRCLSLLFEFIEEFENFSPLVTGKDITLTVKTTFSSCPSEEFPVTLVSTMTFAKVRDVISASIKAKDSLMFMHRGKIIDAKDDKKTLEDLEIDGSAKIFVSEDSGKDVEMMNIDSAPVPEDLSGQISHLRGIFESLDDDLLKLALEKCGFNVEETVMFLLEEANQERLKSHLAVKKTPEVQKGSSKLSELLSDSQEYFALFFNLLKFGNYSLEQQVWKLLDKVPVNKQIFHGIHDIDGSEDWDELFDRKSIHKLLYSLRIVDQILVGQADQWKQNFFELGGAHHLYQILADYREFGLYGFTEARVLDCLLRIVANFLMSSQLISEVWGIVDCRLLLNCALEIIEESSKYNYRMEVYLARTLDFLVILLRHDPSLLSEVYSRSIFDFLISNVLLNSSEPAIRESIVNAVSLIISSFEPSSGTSAESSKSPETSEVSDHSESNPVKHFWRILQEKLPKDNNLNCDEFFKLSSIILQRNPDVEAGFADFCISFILAREVIEDRKELNQDKVVTGYLLLLKDMLQMFPQKGSPDLLVQLYQSLFDLDSSRLIGLGSTPKYKHPGTRKAVFDLILMIARENKSNADKLLDLLWASRYSSPEEEKCEDRGQRLTSAQSSSYKTEPDLRLKSSVGFVGLRNFGSTCYLNSLMQQLFMIDSLKNSLLEASLKSGAQEDSLLYQLKFLMCSLIYSEKECHEPAGFCLAFKGYDGESINPRIQQDADEFLSLLLDKLEDELKETESRDIIRKHVGGSFVHEIESCEDNFPYHSEREEHFFRISLDVKNKKTIAEALDLFIKADVLDGDNKYFCDKYDAKISAKKRCLVKGLENTVIVHLKRFEFDLDSMQRVKVNDYCEFPMHINLKTWCKEQGHNDEYYEFELVGVLLHSGGADSGHYTSIIKERKSQVWYRFDDRYVEKYNVQNLANDCFGGETNFTWAGSSQSYAQTKNAYMLVYERKKTSKVENLEKSENFETSGLSEIIETIKKQNLKFFKDLLYLDPGYYDFIREFSRIYEFSENIEYNLVFSLSSELKELVKITKFIDSHWERSGLTKQEILSHPDFLNMEPFQEPAHDRSFQLMKFITMFAFEIFLNLKNFEVVHEWLRTSQPYFLKHVPASAWLLGFLLEHQDFIKELLFEAKDWSLKEDFSLFLAKISGFLSFYENNFLVDSISLVDVEKLPVPEDYPRYCLYKQVFQAVTSRFLDFLIRSLLKDYLKPTRQFLHFLRILRTLLNSNPVIRLVLLRLETITELLSIVVQNEKPLSLEETEEVFSICNSLLILTRTYAMSQSSSSPCPTIQKLDETAESFLSSYRTQTVFAIYFQLPAVESIILHMSWENFKTSVEYLEYLIDYFFLHKSDLPLALKYLNIIEKLLKLEDSVHPKRVEELISGDLYKPYHHSLARVNFFENLDRMKAAHPVFVMNVIVWWSQLINQVKTVAELSEKHQERFRWVVEKTFEVDTGLGHEKYLENQVGFDDTFQEAVKAFRKIVKSDDESSVEAEIQESTVFVFERNE